MSFLKEFKEFAVKGNVLDLAIGVVIGSAFSKIVTSLVNDIIMPISTLISGKITGNIEIKNLVLGLDGFKFMDLADGKAGESVLRIGLFITNIIDFLIIALSIFIVIKQINRLKPKPAPAPVTTKVCPYCRTSIHVEAAKCPNCTSDLN